MLELALRGTATQMLTTRTFLPTSTVTLIGKGSPPQALESEVEMLWRAEQERRGESLFNGNILSAVEITQAGILGRVAEYRHLVAQRARPQLFDYLQVRPVAVSGLLQCADGIVFGRRARTVTQHPGLWELVPSGGLDTSKVSESGVIDYRAQLLTELLEELGINANSVSSIRPFSLVEDSGSHVIDIGIALASQLSAAQVLRAHREAKTKEYAELRVLSVDEVDCFVRFEASQLVGVSTVLIRQFQNER